MQIITKKSGKIKNKNFIKVIILIHIRFLYIRFLEIFRKYLRFSNSLTPIVVLKFFIRVRVFEKWLKNLTIINQL